MQQVGVNRCSMQGRTTGDKALIRSSSDGRLKFIFEYIWRLYCTKHSKTLYFHTENGCCGNFANLTLLYVETIKEERNYGEEVDDDDDDDAITAR